MVDRHFSLDMFHDRLVLVFDDRGSMIGATHNSGRVHRHSKLHFCFRQCPRACKLPLRLAADGETMMDFNLYQTLGQVSSEDAGQIFRDHLRGFVRQMISDVMASEVSELCGPKHQPSDGDHFRAGSSSGSVLHEGDREDIIRPRVRKLNEDGSSEEVVLATYKAARDPSQLQASIVTALMHGVSTRDVKKINPKSPGVGRSNVSRHWQSVEPTACFRTSLPRTAIFSPQFRPGKVCHGSRSGACRW